MGKDIITDEDIQKALDVLSEFSEKGENIEKSIDTEKKPVEEIQKGLDDVSAQDTEPKTGITEEIVKSIFDDKFKHVAIINRFLVQQNEELVGNVESLQKSLDDSLGVIGEMKTLIEQMANSPINRLSTTMTKSIQVDKFNQGVSNGKKSLSLINNKREVLDMLTKSLETEEGQKRLGNVVGLIENGYVNQSNFDFLKKSVENEIGGTFEITY